MMSRFLEISKGIVEDFLQTAVFLDDRAMFPNEELVTPTVIIDPSTGEKSDVVIPDSGDAVATVHDLDAKAIIDTFMQKGIVCSVIKCEETTFETQRDNYLRLMKKADIVVLDWDLFRDGGAKIIEIIKDLISADEELHELRSIVVYTANDLDTVKTQLGREGLTFEDYISHNKRYTTISLWNKNSSSISSDRKADFVEVVDKCIDEFTETFHGIIPNVAMAAIAEVRKNTHKLLGVLNKHLDPAFLSHRSLLESPDDAEKHIEEIIVSEIESMIYGNEIGRHAALDKIGMAPIISGKTYQNIDFIECLRVGTEVKLDSGQKKDKIAKCEKLLKDVQTCYTKEWYLDETTAKKSEKDFAVLSSLMTEYSSNPYLRLGVIVENASNKYLCIQPRCDSVRLRTTTNFMFLKLIPDNKNFDIILRDGTKYKLKYTLKNRCNFTFTPNRRLNVITFCNQDVNLITHDIHGEEFKYLASLKRLHAQRIANEFSAYISRIGLNESEYIRRNSPRTLAGKL